MMSPRHLRSLRSERLEELREEYERCDMEPTAEELAADPVLSLIAEVMELRKRLAERERLEREHE